ncbi:outer membrane beta-barrel protein [Vibrio paucivorans]
MLSKSLLIPTIILSSLSTYTFADNEKNFYIGADYYGVTNTDSNRVAEQELGPGYAINLGYSYKLAERWSIDGELEYANYGSTDKLNLDGDNPSAYGLDGSSLSLNLKPTYRLKSNGLYLSALFGFGHYNFNSSYYDYTNFLGAYTNDKGVGYSVGFETGYEFDQVIASLGYKQAYVNLNDIELSALYLGLAYRF